MYLRQFIEHERAKPMGAKEVLALSFRSGLRSIDYDDIKGKSLSHLLPGKESGLLILFMDHRSKKQVGHFCLLFKSKNGIEFFDPYGLGLQNVTSITRSRKNLQKLLEGHHFYNNRVKFQKLADSVQTCGRWCITRWNAAHLRPKEFERLMFDRRLIGDDIVVLMTMEQDISKL